ncbi:c-type cytochrome [Thiohalorhabdus denitrificans]|uniref:Cytochrome c2 n=1 Tax=Thiohalorhabdus denitrificans TaxID=381306 RepID=A0A1G5AWQ1_9GAMM|nr:c-type cytochrome [Thiohalorhabdus denitrificans]SCX82266.1 Cytochrome c2 [Thiohalorhabdus denitrificans]
MDERSRRARTLLGTFFLPAALMLAGGFSPEIRAQSTAEAAKGQKIFFKVCVQCHTLKEKSQASGPGLGGVLNRVPSEEWLLKWLEDPEAMVDSGDAYAQSIADDYPLDMPKLEVMQKESNREAIVTFLKEVPDAPEN